MLMSSCDIFVSFIVPFCLLCNQAFGRNVGCHSVTSFALSSSAVCWPLWRHDYAVLTALSFSRCDSHHAESPPTALTSTPDDVGVVCCVCGVLGVVLCVVCCAVLCVWGL